MINVWRATGGAIETLISMRTFARLIVINTPKRSYSQRHPFLMDALVVLFLITVIQTASTVPKVAICFYGLPRAFNLTLPSIVNRIIEPLRVMAHVSIYIHTYNVTTLTNDRSAEYNTSIRPTDALQLLPNTFILEDENQVLGMLPAQFCMKHGDPWNNQYRSFRNFMAQLHSLRRLSELISQNRYDAVVFARIDLYYFTPIDAVQVLRAAAHTVYVPHFHNWNGTNDRFAFGKQNVMITYALRQLSIERYCVIFEAHAERYLLWYLLNNNITIKRTPMMFSRIRGNGGLWEQPTWQLNRNRATIPIEVAENVNH